MQSGLPGVHLDPHDDISIDLEFGKTELENLFRKSQWILYLGEHEWLVARFYEGLLRSHSDRGTRGDISAAELVDENERGDVIVLGLVARGARETCP